MKLTIANRDIDDASETREIAPVELDIDAIDVPADPVAPDFSEAIGKAAADNAQRLAKEEPAKRRREVRAEVEAEFKAVAAKFKEKTGLSIGFDKPWVYQPKVKEAYGLWRRVITMFIELPSTLDVGPTELAKMLDANEPNFSVTRDMMYDKLSNLAERDLARLLANNGIAIKPKRPVTIRSIQKQLIERRDAAKGVDVEEFSGHFVIRGDKAYVNGKPYAIQHGASGKRRIKIGSRDWLPLDTLKAFCVSHD